MGAEGTLCSDYYLLHTTCGLMNLTMNQLYLHGVSVLEDHVFVIVSAYFLVIYNFGLHIGE